MLASLAVNEKTTDEVDYSLGNFFSYNRNATRSIKLRYVNSVHVARTWMVDWIEQATYESWGSATTLSKVLTGAINAKINFTDVKGNKLLHIKQILREKKSVPIANRLHPIPAWRDFYLLTIYMVTFHLLTIKSYKPDKIYLLTVFTS